MLFAASSSGIGLPPGLPIPGMEGGRHPPSLEAVSYPFPSAALAPIWLRTAIPSQGFGPLGFLCPGRRRLDHRFARLRFLFRPYRPIPKDIFAGAGFLGHSPPKEGLGPPAWHSGLRPCRPYSLARAFFFRPSLPLKAALRRLPLNTGRRPWPDGAGPARKRLAPSGRRRRNTSDPECGAASPCQKPTLIPESGPAYRGRPQSLADRPGRNPGLFWPRISANNLLAGRLFQAFLD
jgi:hypothetical protein